MKFVTFAGGVIVNIARILYAEETDDGMTIYFSDSQSITFGDPEDIDKLKDNLS